MKSTAKRRCSEYSFFRNELGRIKHSRYCNDCQQPCKQSFRVTVIVCPKYTPKPR